MICNGQPMPYSMAYHIEAWNLYLNYNRAWMELYLNAWQYYLPRYYDIQNKNNSN
jgi:hypothetical protein